MTEQFKNPIDGTNVDEVIKEKEAHKRGYMDLEFILRHLEDENEFVKVFIINGKKVVVDLEKPMTQYKKKPAINHERILQDTEEKKADIISAVPDSGTCDITDTECLSCSG